MLTHEVETIGALEGALALARAGHRVFPCLADKKPLKGVRWTTEATCEETIIRKWFRRPEVKFAALPCGEQYGFLVIDDDRPKKGVTSPEVFDGPSYRTQNGGIHHFYKFDPAYRTVTDLWPSVDIRTTGGYVCVYDPEVVVEILDWPLPSPPPYPVSSATEKVTRIKREKSGWTLDEAAALLDFVDAGSPRADWLNVLMGFHHEFDDTPDQGRALQIIIDWSSTGGKRFISGSHVAEQWSSFKSTGDDLITLATVIKKAHDNGYTPPIPDVFFEKTGGGCISGFKWVKDSITDLTPPEYVIDEVLQRRGLSLIFGPSGSGKTHVALSLATTIAGSGADWFGHSVEHPGLVVFLAGEGHFGLRIRLALLSQKAGEAPHMITSDAGTDMSDPRAVAALIGQLKALDEPIRAVFVDTLNRNFGGGDENSTQDMTRFVAGCSKVVEELDTMCVVVHHTGLSEKTRPRGSSVLFAAMDQAYGVAMNNGFIELYNTKQKEGPQIDSLNFRLIEERITAFDEAADVSSVWLDLTAGVKNDAGGLTPRQEFVWIPIRDLATAERKIRAVNGDDLVDRVLITREAIKKELPESKHQSLSAILKELEMKGFVERFEQGVWVDL